ncbi:50S ribosomal protein L10 [Candidatus Peregrinibacteria bacterium]|nr:50S ribosomal protein L10 [Candidatus Peregrinibacteria bacterium]
MPVTRQQKEKILQELVSHFKEAKAVIFTEFRGLTMLETEDLREKLREQKIDHKVAKKTLIQKASKETGFPDIDAGTLEGPISVSFGYEDVILPCKLLSTFAKAHPTIQIRGGFIEGKLLNREEIQKLASLPSKEQLIAQFVGTLKAPMNGFYGILHGTLQKFVLTLNAVKEKKTS